MQSKMLKFAIIGALLSTVAVAHPNHELTQVRLATAQWAAAIQSGSAH